MATQTELQTTQRLVEDRLYQEAAFADRAFAVSVAEYATALGVSEQEVRDVFERLRDAPGCALTREGKEWRVEV